MKRNNGIGYNAIRARDGKNWRGYVTLHGHDVAFCTITCATKRSAQDEALSLALVVILDCQVPEELRYPEESPVTEYLIARTTTATEFLGADVNRPTYWVTDVADARRLSTERLAGMVNRVHAGSKIVPVEV